MIKITKNLIPITKQTNLQRTKKSTKFFLLKFENLAKSTIPWVLYYDDNNELVKLN